MLKNVLYNYDELVHPEFQLYLYFLQGKLPTLASINTQQQNSDQNLFTAYQKIVVFLMFFTEYGSTQYIGIGMVPSIIDVWGYDREFCSSSPPPPPSCVTQEPNNIKLQHS